MIDVVRAIAAAAAVQTPTLIDCADSQPATIRPSISLGVSNSLPGVFRNFALCFEVSDCEAAFPLNRRVLY